MTVEAYAKVNLTLEVFGKRADGYHALRSVVLPVSLADTLEIEDAPTLTSDTGYADDLCLKAARVLCPTRGATIHVTKRIPAGGGLGGGSADAAATLLALNDLWGLHHTRAELAAIGAQVGSDVPSLVLAHDGGPVLMEGRGEQVTPMRSAGARELHLVLANPGVFSSTREVYAACVSRPADGVSLSQKMLTALATGTLADIAAALMNDLQLPAVALHPEIATTLERLRDAGAEGVLMSGSGSTVFGLVPSASAGEELAARLVSEGLWARHVEGLKS